MNDARPATRNNRRMRRWRRAVAVSVVLLVLALAAGYAMLSGQAGVDFAVREVVRRSNGALAIEGATGSLLDTVRIRRVAWQGPDANVVAHDVVLAWSPVALLSRGIVVRGLGVHTLSLDFKPSAADVPMPTDLALPFEITIEHLAVGELAWRVGANGGTLRGLAFGYAGGASGHRLSDLELVADAGAISGNATLAAAPPFPVAGRLTIRGDAAFAGVDAAIELSGTLAELALEATGKSGPARFAGHARLAPLARVPLKDIALEAGEVDLAAIDASLPATRVTASIRASPVERGFAGTLEATNAMPGALDASRLPIATLATQFAWRDSALTLDRLSAGLPGGASLAGTARIPLGGRKVAGTWSLDVRDVDLREIHASLVPTRLTGKVAADLDAQPQRISADVADRTIVGGVALDFAAIVENDIVTVERFRARAGSGELAGRGRVAIAGERAFDIDARATRFDPARYGDFPAGSIDGHIAATGALVPTWHARAEIAIAPGSRLAGVAIAGKARGAIGPEGVRDAVANLAIGKAKLTATGSVAEAGEGLRVTLEAPDMAELAPFLPKKIAQPLSGALHLQARLRGVPPGAGIELEATARRLRFGPALALGSAELHANLAPGPDSGSATGFATRKMHVDIAATNVVTPSGAFRTARAEVDGTLGEHRLSIAFAGEDLDVTAQAHGGLAVARSSNHAGTPPSWSGTLDALENRGTWALRLAAPAPLELGPSRIRVGEARVIVADGSVQLSDFVWDDGRMHTQGRFSAVPVLTVARLAGVTLPVASTITLGGEWSLAATPRLNGTALVRREGGDLWLLRGTAPDPGLAAGITRFDAAARFTEDALDATASFRSTRAGTAEATLAIGAFAGAPPGRLAPDAPLALSVRADLASLQLLQPWIGTAFAIDGRARLDLTAQGTVRNAPVSGTLVGENLRIDAPQYGLHFTNGRFAGRAEGGRVSVDDLVLHAGAGSFRASGEIIELAPGGPQPSARLNWRAEKFRLFNRPDLRLVVGGEGTLVSRDAKLVLSGRLKADEGMFVYYASPETTLGDDVVVKGWPRRTAGAWREGDVALDVDLVLDLGENLRFSGEGLETGLEGEVRVTNGPAGLLGKGSIRAVNGTYFAFGKRLTIDRGRLVFDGRLDNPGLDIVALRKGPAVEAGVAITGTVKVPIIQLTSNPPVPDSEKLAWLVLGQGLDRTTGSDYAALQAASGALLGQSGRAVSTSLAQSIGVDDISIRGASGAQRGAAGTPDATGQVIAVGKRLSDRISVVYEQGLTVATNALRIEYELTRSLTLRAEAGTISGVGVYFRRSFD